MNSVNYYLLASLQQEVQKEDDRDAGGKHQKEGEVHGLIGCLIEAPPSARPLCEFAAADAWQKKGKKRE